MFNIICFGYLKTNIEISTTRGEAIQLFLFIFSMTVTYFLDLLKH